MTDSDAAGGPLEEEETGNVIYRDDEFLVRVEEVTPFWRWLIFRAGRMVQEGVSISERSARDAALTVAAYLRGR
ncbi:hypothetical protein ACF09G_31845 [Streptomyces albogriseolus]|uniref:hypothetical protein n=1 Tax=Streptomyces TaxID=1883 RepID=UPI001414FC53|nr:hypothetical protein [Streptomyces sp. GC420]MBC7273055.1 hypothetical protein [Streptomyces sp.]